MSNGSGSRDRFNLKCSQLSVYCYYAIIITMTIIIRRMSLHCTILPTFTIITHSLSRQMIFSTWIQMIPVLIKMIRHFSVILPKPYRTFWMISAQVNLMLMNTWALNIAYISNHTSTIKASIALLSLFSILLLLEKLLEELSAHWQVYSFWFYAYIVSESIWTAVVVTIIDITRDENFARFPYRIADRIRENLGLWKG